MNPVFKTSDFRRLWLNSTTNAISVAGDYVLIGWLTIEVTQSSAWVGIAYALYYLPMVVLGVPAGSAADRFDRRRLLRWLEFLSFAIMAVFTWLFAYRIADLTQVMWLTLALGALRATIHPVRLSFVYDLVGPAQVTPALAGISLGARTGMIVGALAAGTLTHRYGVAWALLVMALSHFVALLCLTGEFHLMVRKTLDTTPLLQNLKDYLTEARTNHVLLVLTIVTAAIEVFGTSYSTVLPELAEKRLGLGAQGLGWMSAALACGGLVIGFLLFVLPQRRHNTVLYAASIVTLGLSVMALGYAPNLVTVLLALAAISGMITAWDIYTQSMMQLCVPDGLRGRAMGAWVFAIGSAPLGHLEIGLFAAYIGVELSLYANGFGVIAVIGIAYLANKSLRRL